MRKRRQHQKISLPSWLKNWKDWLPKKTTKEAPQPKEDVYVSRRTKNSIQYTPKLTAWLVSIGVIVLFFVISWTIVTVKTYMFVPKEIITFTSLDTLSSESIAYRSMDEYRKNLYIWSSKNSILQHLQKTQKNLKDINIQRKLPNTFVIDLISYQPVFRTIIDSNSFIITSNGTLIPKDTTDLPFPLIQIPNTEARGLFFNYQEYIDLSTMKQLLSLFKHIHTHLNLTITKILLLEKEQEVHIELESGVSLLFDLKEDYGKQISKLEYYQRKTELDIFARNFIYIDARVPNKIFTCGLDAEWDCRKNLEYVYPEIY